MGFRFYPTHVLNNFMIMIMIFYDNVMTIKRKQENKMYRFLHCPTSSDTERQLVTPLLAVQAFFGEKAVRIIPVIKIIFFW